MLLSVYSLFTLWPISQLLAYNLASVLDNSIIGTPKVVCEESEVILDILTAKPFIGLECTIPMNLATLSYRQCFRQRPCQRLRVPSIFWWTRRWQKLQQFLHAKPWQVRDAKASFGVQNQPIHTHHFRSFARQIPEASVLPLLLLFPSILPASSQKMTVPTIWVAFTLSPRRLWRVALKWGKYLGRITSGLDFDKFWFSQLPAQELSDHMSMPSCRYSVHSGSIDGPQLSWANVGDTVFHLWECKGPELGMLVKKVGIWVIKCNPLVFAVFCNRWGWRRPSGGGWRRVKQKFRIFRTYFFACSCSLDLGLLSEIAYEDGKMRAHAKSQVFKYADSNQLFFTCQIRF